MNINTDDMVSVTDIRSRGISFYLSQAATGRTIAIMKNNKVQAVLTGSEAMEQLQALDEREENLRLWSAAIIRYATDEGARHELADVAAELGISPAELED